MDEIKKLPTIGFIGTGTITAALVTGFCERASDVPYPIVVSPRNKENAARLNERFPERVTVAESMQEVLDRSEWVVLAVLPPVGEEVCRSLDFRPDHKVINLLSDKTLPQIRSWIGETAELVHMVPLTFNEFTNGPIILCPPQKEAAEIFGHIGNVVEVEERYHAAVLAAITGCVVPFYSVMETLIRWAASEGVPAEVGTAYVTSFFQAIGQEAAGQDFEGVHTLATVATPGGINLMAGDMIRQAGGFATWEDAMTAALNRLAANIPK